MIDLGTRITITVDGGPLEMMPVHVAVGFTNDLFPLSCNPAHRHQPGDTVWTRTDRDPRNRVLFCDPCARGVKR